MDAAALGTAVWADDFIVWLVANATAAPAANTPRVVSVNDSTGYTIYQGSGTMVANAGEGSPNFGLAVPWSLNTVHTLLSYRIGTTHYVSVDGAAPVTSTVPAVALSNNPLCIGYSSGFPGNIFVGHFHEFGAAKLVGTTPDKNNIVAKMAQYLADQVAAGAYSLCLRTCAQQGQAPRNTCPRASTITARRSRTRYESRPLARPCSRARRTQKGAARLET